MWFSESPCGESQAEDSRGKAFHILKDIEVTLPGDVKYLRDLFGKFLQRHRNGRDKTQNKNCSFREVLFLPSQQPLRTLR